ncbi:hypothetical protein ACFRFL_14005 [Streptomyces sp. NPDC056708]|uniref:hypothetical protein n=1 Tax=unclassified Streptomyces TaxID=2593676 RepID=UPI00369980A1
MKGLGWLNGSNDRQLAATQYEGRESATDRAARLRREKHQARVIRDGDNSGTLPRGFRWRG